MTENFAFPSAPGGLAPGRVRPPVGEDLLVTVDTLVAGVHFPEDASPEAVGHKAAAVNLSDLAAMGASPSWLGGVLNFPDFLDGAWLEAFRRGFDGLCQRFAVAAPAIQVRPGPLSVTVQAWGAAPPGQVLRRAGARPGDAIYVTGTLGDAALAVQYRVGKRPPAPATEDFLDRRLDRPEPRIAVGRAIAGIASAAIDLSDGLAADLGHVLAASGVGARLALGALPLSAAVTQRLAVDDALECALAGGDDYELCFTVSPAREAELLAVLEQAGEAVTRIGEIQAEPGLWARHPDGSVEHLPLAGYEHFRAH